MIKDTAHKLFFPRQHEELEALKILVHKQNDRTIQEMLDRKRRDARPQPSMADLMREVLGLPALDFHNVDEFGKPPHYLKDLPEDVRKQWISELESIYSNPKFTAVSNYIINLLGNHSFWKATEENMRNGRIAAVGLKTFLLEFETAHMEYISEQRKKDDEPEDKFAVL